MSIKKRKKPSCTLFICCTDAWWRKGLQTLVSLMPLPPLHHPYAPAPTPTCFPHFYPASPSSASLFPHHLPHIFLCFLLSSPFCHSLQPFLFVLSLSSSPLNFLPFVLTLWFTKTLSLSPPLHSYLSSPRFSCSRPL
jgi:hypothetical protein